MGSIVPCLVNSDQIFKDTITVCTTKHYAEYKVQTSVEFQVSDKSVVCEIATCHIKTVWKFNFQLPNVAIFKLVFSYCCKWLQGKIKNLNSKSFIMQEIKWKE